MKNNSNASAILNKYIISIEVLVEVEIEVGISQAAYEHLIPFPDNLNGKRSTILNDFSPDFSTKKFFN